MSDQTRTVSEVREHLTVKAATDEAFRARLIADPKTAIQDEMGLVIPDGFTVKVHEEQPDTSHLVLPPPTALGEPDLEQAAGAAIYRRDPYRGDWVRQDEAITFWDDVNGPTYIE